jgi:chaperonin GroES
MWSYLKCVQSTTGGCAFLPSPTGAETSRREAGSVSLSEDIRSIITYEHRNLYGGLRIMKLTPLNDRILVKRLEGEEKTAGGLFIPDTAKEKPSKGEVVAVGPGKTTEDGKKLVMTVKAGDQVLFNKYAGTEIKLDGVDHLVLREDDVLAIIG